MPESYKSAESYCEEKQMKAEDHSIESGGP